MVGDPTLKFRVKFTAEILENAMSSLNSVLVFKSIVKLSATNRRPKPLTHYSVTKDDEAISLLILNSSKSKI